MKIRSIQFFPHGATLLVRSGLTFSIVLWLACPGATQAATLIVSNNGDSGAGTLRQAILDANTNATSDTITFQISGSGVHTITPLTTLPALTAPVIIDGTTQPGYTSQPLIELNGASAGLNAGLRLLAGNSTVRGLAINRFQTDGIDISGPGSNVIAGNYIGTDPTGLIARGNEIEGVLISLSSGNLIGGTNVSDRNVISANFDAGIYMLTSTNNVVIGNFIGTTATGAARLGNLNNGVAIYNSPSNFVGGASTGSRNIISGNTGSGAYLFGPASSGNIVQGNYMGLDVGGTLSMSNSADGISCQGGLNNTIGGTIAAAGNVISANGFAGVSLSGGAAGNVLLGNLIGSDSTGTVALGNLLAGVTISGAVSNTIGQTISGARNVIAGNKQDGVFLTAGSSGNLVAGNYLGLKISGTTLLANLFNGVTLSSAASNSIVGNVISGNAGYGVQIVSNAPGNLLQSNFVGTDAAGSSAVPNTLSGVRVESAGNTIGTAGAGNVISANVLDGINIFGIPASNNLVQANFIGVTVGGAAGLGNSRAGVGVSGAPANKIGVPGAGNVISANKDAGIYLVGSGTVRNIIQANTLGASADGTTGLGNSYEGIYLERSATNTIGGTAAGAGNLISGNNTRGIWLTNASWNVIQGNFIGTKSDGISALGNVFHNVECEVGAANNTIGGSAPGAGNRIAFAQSVYAGVRIRDLSTNNSILGNSIFSNGALGIDLSTVGVSPNDANDGDTGANMLQNFPIVTQSATSGSSIGVRGTLNSTPSKNFLLQFFASPTCDGSGNGEGQIYLGDKSVVTAASGNVSFVATFACVVPVGYMITSTATDSANNTSEFSACQAVTSVPTLSIAPAAGNQVTLTWTNTTTGFVLKQTGNLSPPAIWSTVPNSPANAGGNFVVTTALGSTNRFFLLNFE